jgi:Rab GDP dissociation inhibitor
MGNAHQVCAKGKYVAIVSTTVETDKPAAEIAQALELIGGRITQFDNIVDTFTPVEDGSKSRVFISTSYDASSHFEATTKEVLGQYKRITGEQLDLNISSELQKE